MDRARDEKLEGVLAGQALPGAEQQRRSQCGPTVRQMLVKHPHPTATQSVEDRRDRHRRGPGDHGDTVGLVRPHDRQAAQRPRAVAKVELPRVERRRRPQPAAEQPDPGAGGKQRRRTAPVT